MIEKSFSQQNQYYMPRTPNDTAGGFSSFATAVGMGLVAGLAGTVAISIFQQVEMKLSNREPSEMPSKIGGRVLGVQPRNQEGRQRFNMVMHVSYGTMWGLARGMMGLVGLKGWPATALHWAMIWGTEMVMVPSLSKTPTVDEWEPPQIVKDGLMHASYAIAAGLVYDALDRDVWHEELLEDAEEIGEDLEETGRRNLLSWLK